MSTITKSALREIVADVLREHRSSSPGECADQIMDTLHRMAPRAFVNEIEFSADEKLRKIARELMLAASVNIDTWEIAAYNRSLTEDEVQEIDDLIGQASVKIEF